MVDDKRKSLSQIRDLLMPGLQKRELNPDSFVAALSGVMLNDDDKIEDIDDGKKRIFVPCPPDLGKTWVSTPNWRVDWPKSVEDWMEKVLAGYPLTLAADQQIHLYPRMRGIVGVMVSYLPA